MVKRILAAFLLSVAFASQALAALPVGIVGTATGSDHMVHEPILWRTHAAAFGPGVAGYHGVDLLGGYSDSLIIKRVGNGTAVLCTTVAIATKGWTPVKNQALSDTSGFFCRLTLSDATGASCESGADSIYTAIQVSSDGLTWASACTFKGGAAASITSRLSQANATGTFFGALSLNGAALAQGAPMWQQLYKTRAVSSLDALDVTNLVGWPFIRFIVGLSDAKGYMVKGVISHYSVEE